ncbi:NADH dehydrogenase [ubiquinone] 1 alpha subcomplex subunit 11 [Tachyglossus aculeatus]|uniref:NADH dehydrogenase [ubiquinone] 1 alpha subcomplex subunit 11 n=1 Tax=Tachyglossus aculeatus TaxID=9261 RepID=UPI0018F54DAE|nr:NADH dehydrogenase [ubiquinone] 1 alpha subcomplex subunit 11 [Tachyglossus aculeatus]
MASRLVREYWDIPDGTDCHRKAYVTTKMGSGIGLIASAYNLVFYPPESLIEGMQRAGKYTFTMAAVGAMFGITSCISAQVREKPDDPLNYFFGGCAAGLTFGVRTHNYMTGASACMYLGVAAALLKMGKLEGWQIGGPPRL